jgi:hypothetical protein
MSAEKVAGCKYLAYATRAAAIKHATPTTASIFLVRDAIGFLRSP